MDNSVYWIWLQQALPIAWPHTARLLREIGDARTVYGTEEETLRAAGLSGSVLASLTDRSLAKAEKIRRSAEEKGLWILTPDNPEYPDGWAALPDLPLAVYGKGRFPEDFGDRLSLTVLATRRISRDGERLTGGIAAGLSAAGVIVVGDTIAGGDEAAMTAVSAVGGMSVIVQPCGADISYPKSTEKLRRFLVESGGVVLSEFVPGTPVRRENFGIRNRLLATLSQGVVVTEAGEQSGTVRVAGLAVRAGHEVFAVPGDRTRHAGSHRLIRDGAFLVQSATDILQEFIGRYPTLSPSKAEAAETTYRQFPPPTDRSEEQPKKPVSARKSRAKRAPVVPFSVVHRTPTEADESSPLPAGLSERAAKLAACLTASPQGTDALSEQTGIPSWELTALLTELELAGVAQAAAGGRYARR